MTRPRSKQNLLPHRPTEGDAELSYGWDPPLFGLLLPLLRDITRFSAEASGLTLRSYQVAVAKAIVTSVRREQGLSFVVLFPRQSGKNELQAQLETYLLALFAGPTEKL
jgi:hypothetical protein